MAKHGQEGEQRRIEPPADSNRPRPDADLVEQPLDTNQVSGTGVVGDETNVRTREGIDEPGIADKIPPRDKNKSSLAD